MNKDKILKRVSEVLKPDAVTNDKIDFLATHTPFKKIKFKSSGSITEVTDSITEEDIYNRFLLESKDEHKFVIVRGDNGTGKSHLIRWLHELYLKEKDDNNEEIIFISKHQSTLRDAIEQLINSNVIKNTTKYEEIKKLLDANDHLDSDRLKDIMVHQFAIEVEDSKDYPDRKIEKGLYSLLMDPVFKKYILREGGPIDRIQSKLINKDNSVKDEIIPIFKVEDFILDYDILTKIRSEGGSRHTVKLAEYLARENAIELSTMITHFLNKFIDKVIQTSTNLRSTDLKKLFLNIRKELKKQGKSLTLFIEDITSFTGVDKAIVDVLVTEHKGVEQNTKLCRLCSLIGITTNYYKNKFPDHLKDRVTDQLFIEEEVFGETENLKELTARYLNAIYKPKEEFDIWMKNGALQNELPIFNSDEFKNWEYVDLGNDRLLTIYPFTEYSLVNLYRKLKHKTPRMFLKEVVKKYLESYFMSPETFLSFVPFDLPRWEQPSHPTILEKQSTKEELKRLKNIFAIWGNGTIYRCKHDKYETIGGINTEFFSNLNASIITGILKDDSANKKINNNKQTSNKNKRVNEENKNNKLNGEHDNGTFNQENKNTSNNDEHNNNELHIASHEKTSRNSPFDIVQKDIEDWSNGKPLNNFIRLRDDLHNFVVSSINWQQLDVSPYLVYTMLSNKRLIGIEGQTQGEQNARILVKRNYQGNMVLLALAAWRNLGGLTWNFNDSAEYQYYLVNWMLSIKNRLIEIVKNPNNDNDYDNLDIINTSIIINYYRLALSGNLTGKENALDIYKKMMVEKIDFKELNTHTEIWKKTATINSKGDYHNNHILMYKYFSYVIGDASKQSNSHFIDANKLYEIIYNNHLNNWGIDNRILSMNKNNINHTYYLPVKLIKNQYKQIVGIYNSETNKCREIIKVIKDEIGSINLDTIKLVLSSISNYLLELQRKYNEPYDENFVIICDNLKRNTNDLYDNIKRLMDVIDDQIPLSKSLAILSSNPYLYVEEFKILLLCIKGLVYDIDKKYKNKRIHQRNREDELKFTSYDIKNELIELKKKYKKFKEELANVNG